MSVDLFNASTPKGAWLASLEKDYSAAAPIADEIVRVEHGAFEGDARQELVSAWLAADPTAAVRAALCVAVGHQDDAKATLRKSLATFLAANPARAATIVSPTRRQLAKMWGRGAPLDLSHCQTIDDMSGADRRSVARKLIGDGHDLVPRSEDDDGGFCSPARRGPRVSTVERGRISVDVIQHEAHDEHSSGAMVSPRPFQRRVLGGPDAPPHPRPSQVRAPQEPQE